MKRLHPRKAFDGERFSEFRWLVVEEVVALEQKPEARAVPALFKDMSQDPGRFPRVVEDALFLLLLAPWESWATMVEVDWCSLRVPWVSISSLRHPGYAELGRLDLRRRLRADL